MLEEKIREIFRNYEYIHQARYIGIITGPSIIGIAIEVEDLEEAKATMRLELVGDLVDVLSPAHPQINLTFLSKKNPKSSLGFAIRLDDC